MALIGIGAILSAGEIWLQIDGATINWGVLQAIGAAGLMTLFVIALGSRWRLMIGLSLLVLYQFLLDNFWLNSVLHSPHGGMPGSVSWAAMMILATVFADLFHSSRAETGTTATKRVFFLAACLLALAGGLLLMTAFPISKNRVSGSYVLISLATSGLLFAAFARFKLRLPTLAAWGKNPLVLYVLHLLLLGLMVLPDIPAWYSAAPAWLVTLQACALIGLLSATGRWLEKKNITIAL